MASISAAYGTPVVAVPAKGLKTGALNLAESTVIGVASTAPAYSLAATLGYVVLSVGTKAPAVVLLAFIPMLCVAVAYQQLNKVDPDCGTTFTWAAKVFGPRTGWMGGWAIVVADVLVMASLAQIAGQYFFLLIGMESIGENATSPWVLMVGVLWIVGMSWICYRGIEVSAKLQQYLLVVEIIVLGIFAFMALYKALGSSAPETAIHPSWSWFTPTGLSASDLITGVLLMVFIYWGWDSAVACNEETKDSTRTPGLAAVLSVVILVGTYLFTTVAAQSYAGVGDTGIGLGNEENANDVFKVIGDAVFAGSGFGSFMIHALLFLVLTSAAACTQTTILPTARTTLAMAAYKALPDSFGKMHSRFLTPTTSTVLFAVASVALYVPFNFLSGGNLIADSVTAIGLSIALYYGMTGFACAWHFRHSVKESFRDGLVKVLIPLAGGLMLLGALIKSAIDYWGPDSSYTTFHGVGGVFIIGVGSLLLGVVLMFAYQLVRPDYFRGTTLDVQPEIVAANTD